MERGKIEEFKFPLNFSFLKRAIQSGPHHLSLCTCCSNDAFNSSTFQE